MRMPGLLPMGYRFIVYWTRTILLFEHLPRTAIARTQCLFSDGTMAGNTGISRKTAANIRGRRIRIAPGQSQEEVPAAEMPEITSSILQHPFFISKIRLKNLFKSRIS